MKVKKIRSYDKIILLDAILKARFVRFIGTFSFTEILTHLLRGIRSVYQYRVISKDSILFRQIRHCFLWSFRILDTLVITDSAV